MEAWSGDAIRCTRGPWGKDGFTPGRRIKQIIDPIALINYDFFPVFMHGGRSALDLRAARQGPAVGRQGNPRSMLRIANRIDGPGVLAARTAGLWRGTTAAERSSMREDQAAK